MSFVANRGNAVVISTRMSDEDWRYIKRGDLLCVECGAEMYPRTPTVLNVRRHFVHYQDDKSCSQSAASGMSGNHLLAQVLIREFLELEGWSVRLEHTATSGVIARRADVFAEKGGASVVHEVELKRQTVQEQQSRNDDYTKAGHNVVWWQTSGRFANGRIEIDNQGALFTKLDECLNFKLDARLRPYEFFPTDIPALPGPSSALLDAAAKTGQQTDDWRDKQCLSPSWQGLVKAAWHARQRGDLLRWPKIVAMHDEAVRLFGASDHFTCWGPDQWVFVADLGVRAPVRQFMMQEICRFADDRRLAEDDNPDFLFSLFPAGV